MRLTIGLELENIHVWIRKRVHGLLGHPFDGPQVKGAGLGLGYEWNKVPPYKRAYFWKVQDTPPPFRTPLILSPCALYLNLLW